MKVTRFFIFAAIVGSMLVGCSKEKDDKNVYTYDGKIFKIAWAGYYEEEDGYCFGISHTIPAGPLSGEDDFFEVDYPAAKLGVKCDLSQNCSDTWSLYGYLRNVGYYYDFQDRQAEGEGYVPGTDNWVKVTKKSTDNFTIEFAMTINGKRLTGNYTGKFKKYENYDDVGLIL